VNDIRNLARALRGQGYGDRLRFNEPLSGYTSFAIGGPADLLVVARTLDELCDCARMAWAEGVPSLVIGSGTNILASDLGTRGLAIINACRGFSGEGGTLIAESGALLRDVARWSLAHAWAGLEWAVDVPGTVGGAVIGNAGAYGGCMADVVQWVDLLRADGSRERLRVAELDYSYRASALKRAPRDARRPVVLEVALRLLPDDAKVLAARAAQFSEQRRWRTPEGCCAGSTFKRTLQYPAGFLIEQAGLKGCRIGGAQVSTKHANFLMNVGGATAADVKALIEKVQRVVWATFAQRLEPEIELVGDWPERARKRERA
jgi:UDP-N-acetylmuramate dehydrogenase